MLLAAQSDGAVSQRLAADLADVESRFNAELLSDLECVNALVGHVERYRGKMLRPSLVLLTFAACRPDVPTTPDAHRILATVVEMVHMATLVHDDILDEATIRRRGATINQLAGNEAAVMLGDYLISHAYHLCSVIDDPAVSRAIAEATNTVCEGELLQLANRRNWRLDERTYFEIIRRKTASLCGACCRVSASMAGATDDAIHAADQFGEKLGVAFQIVDDLLDLTGEQEVVGKTLGRDVEKGKLTLPVIHYLSSSSDADRAELLGLLQDGSAGEGSEMHHLERQARIREQVAASGAVERAQVRAQQLVYEAKQPVIRTLPDSPAREVLLRMADAVLSRRF